MNREQTTYLSGKRERHDGLLTEDQQHTLGDALVCGAGVGGTGGWTYLTLARMGVRRFRLADGETFDASNANRQACCTFETVGQSKAETVAGHIRAISPGAQVEVADERLRDDTVADFVKDGSAVLDGVDLSSLEVKKRLYDVSREAGIPLVSCPVLGFGAALVVFHPTRSPSFEQHFGAIPADRDSREFREYLKTFGMGYFCLRPRLNWAQFMKRVYAGAVPTVAAACMLSGAWAATAIADVLLGGDNFPCAPTTVHIDLREQRVVAAGPVRRWFFKQALGLYLRLTEQRSGVGR